MNIEEIIEQLKRSNLSLDETETTLSLDGSDRSVWYAWTNDRVMIRRFAKIGGELVKHDEWGVTFKLRDDQVHVRKGKRKIKPMSKAQKDALVKRLQASRLPR